MKKLTTLTLIGAASALALSATAASAQMYGDRYSERPMDRHDYVSIDQRMAQLDRRIERGVRRGDLTREEAYRLRAQFRQIARLEARYRVDGLNRWERADLDRRFDRLSSEIRWNRHDNQYGYGYGYDYRR